MSRYASNADRTLRLRHPIGGVSRGATFQDQEPFTTPRAVNVVPTDTPGGRDRVAQRPGLARLYPQQLTGAVRMLGTVTRVLSNPPQRWADELDALPSSSIYDTKIDGGAAVLSYLAAENGVQSIDALRTPLDLDTTKPYTLEVDFNRPTNTAPFNPFEIDVRFRYANSSPIAGDGTFVRFYLANQTSQYTVKIFENNTEVATTALLTETPGTSGTIRVSVNDGGVDKKIVVSVFGADRLTFTLSSANSNSKQRVGLRASTTPITYPDSRGVLTAFRVVYTSNTPAAEAAATVLCASANGELFADNPSGTIIAGQLVKITQSPNVLTLSSTRRLMAAELLQKLFIADHDPNRYVGTTAISISNTGAVTGGPDWTTRGIRVLDDVAIVLSTTGSAVAGVYKITSISGTTLQLAGYTAAGSGTGIVRVVRAMKVYDPALATNPLNIWQAATGKGFVPHGCTLAVRCWNSILCGGDPQAPSVWQCSRRDDAFDFLFSAPATDKGRAIAGTVTNQSNVTGPITALIPFWNDFAIFATANSMYVMRGDPRLGGRLDTITERTGIIDRFAWCLTAEGNLIYLAHDGLRMVGASVSPQSEMLSHDKIPAELRGLDPTQIEISMEYDVNERGVLIGLTPPSGTASHWFFDLKNRGFWETTFPAVAQPRLQCVFNSENPSLRGVAIGGGDGYIRSFRRSQFFDDVPALAMADKRIASSVTLGPFGPAGRDNTLAAMLETIEAQLAAGSGPIAWKVFAAPDAESCVAQTTPFASGTWTSLPTARRTLRQLIKARGGAFLIQLDSADTTGATSWTFDGLDARLRIVGPQRVL